jgi:catechol 1,2-dioxygenase
MDLKITEDEIHAAADFLDSLGQAGEGRDLLDIFLGVTSVVATEGTPGGTTPNLAGPYYKRGAPLREHGKLYDGELPEGNTPLLIRGTVRDAATGTPVSGAELDLWQPDFRGIYDLEGYFLRGRVRADTKGYYELRTAFPEGYEIPAKGPTTQLLELIGRSNWRPAHIHVRVGVDGKQLLQTQFFMAGARWLEADPVEAVRDDLIIEWREADGGQGRIMDFDIRVPTAT